MVNRLAATAHVIGQIRDPRTRPWSRTLPRTLAGVAVRGYTVGCNICGWHGMAFQGSPHSESAVCPGCGSISRDRFLYHCWTNRLPYQVGTRLLETSPRLGAPYRSRMRKLTKYLASDYDLRAHSADVQIDLQSIDLPDASLDVILTTHTLEHVPDTEKSLSEIKRVLSPGGSAFIMVPVPQGRTAPPIEPEYHADHTLVFWRFGWDFVDIAERVGLEATTLVTSDLIDRIRTGRRWEYGGADVDVNSLFDGAADYVDRFNAVASEQESAWMCFEPSFFFIVWHCRRPVE